MKTWHATLVTLFLALTAVSVSAASLADDGNRLVNSRSIFDSVRDRIYQVRSITVAGDVVSSSGSGFLVGANGLIATNWHVIVNYLLEPGQYRLEVRRHDDTRIPVRIVGIDAMNDLALLRLEGETRSPLPLRIDSPVRGERGFVLGDPKGVGFTVADGTYNGIVAHSMAGYFHFTAPLNQGMSGGPAIDTQGRVFGINVRRYSDADSMGFLVPARHLAALIARTPEAARDSAALLEEARQGILKAQDLVTERFLASAQGVQTLGSHTIPAVSETEFRCRGSSQRKDGEGYETEILTCSSDLSVSAGRGHSAAQLWYLYSAVRNLSLNALQFANQIGSELSSDKDGKGHRQVVDRFACTTSFVAIPTGTVRASLCLRRYLRFEGILEARLRFTTTDRSDEALLGDLSLSGFTEANIRRISRHFMESVTWTR